MGKNHEDEIMERTAFVAHKKALKEARRGKRLVVSDEIGAETMNIWRKTITRIVQFVVFMLFQFSELI